MTEQIPNRVSLKRLKMMAPDLSERDKDILSTTYKCRYLTTVQIHRLHFNDAVNSVAGFMATYRNLNKLKNLGLLDTLKRRIGGVRAGSSSLVWYLNAAGKRLLKLNDTITYPHKRSFEPSPYFLAHTLAVAECFIQLKEICNEHNLTLAKTELEPDCWRFYNHKGKQVILKPDLSAVTICGDYEDRWLIEIDRGTEALKTILKKCQRYHDYYQNGLEQKQHNMFPLTIWIVSDELRKESLTAYIKDEFKKLSKIFIVIMPDELKTLISQGADVKLLC